ncbi:MAG: MmgE/PrpD family protein, partial [Gammaproteobacteria bacterium]|nr:MmgE/PrpD family protein [Gammaproteobacteria bacterium]
MNALERLADWVANSSRQQSPDNLDRAVNSLIDTLACNLSGIREPVVSKLYRSIRGNSTGEVTAFGFGQTSAANAAMVNATAAHSQEFDDYNRSSVAHTSAVLIPSSLAVAEQYDYSG